LEFIPANYEVNSKKYDEKFMENLVQKRMMDVVQSIAGHYNVKLINPEYFYNNNEKKFIRIIERWFYCAFVIKLGVYSNKYTHDQGEEMDIEM
jgi:hypothetical protein